MKPSSPNGKQRPRGRNNMGGKKHMPQRGQSYDGSTSDVRVRGNAHQVMEKYLALARDASSQGDRIAAENYYQHAEHYFRVISAHNNNNQNAQRRPMQTPAEDQALPEGDEVEESASEAETDDGETQAISA